MIWCFGWVWRLFGCLIDALILIFKFCFGLMVRMLVNLLVGWFCCIINLLVCGYCWYCCIMLYYLLVACLGDLFVSVCLFLCLLIVCGFSLTCLMVVYCVGIACSFLGRTGCCFCLGLVYVWLFLVLGCWLIDLFCVFNSVGFVYFLIFWYFNLLLFICWFSLVFYFLFVIIDLCTLVLVVLMLA